MDKVGIIGLGYVGLPLAVAFADAGCDVVGVDSDPAKADSVNAGRSYIEDISDASLERVQDRLTATSDSAALSSCDAIVICVPTPLTKAREPDLSYLNQAAESVAKVIQAGQLVVLESTSFPGTTREILAPTLASSGLQPGIDFHLAFSPERIDPGRTDFTIRTTPKLVGGLTEACGSRALELYERVCDRIVPLSSPDAAELAKLLENVFRSVNIAFVNELAQLCDKLSLDVWEVIEAADTKPFGFMRFDPGPGMGGHCLPVDPFYLGYAAKRRGFYPEFIELAGKVNQAQPAYCVERARRALNAAGKAVKGSRVLVLGVSYKQGIGDTRESPALKIIRLLLDSGAVVSYHDPHVAELAELDLRSRDLDPAVEESDLVVIATAHSKIDYAAIAGRAALLLDLRHAVPDRQGDNLLRL